jgi:hypothetical protein
VSAETAASQAPSEGYILKCTWCAYDSQKFNGLTFPSATGVAAQLNKLLPPPDVSPDVVAFQALRTHFQRAWQHHPSLSGSGGGMRSNARSPTPSYTSPSLEGDATSNYVPDDTMLAGTPSTIQQVLAQVPSGDGRAKLASSLLPLCMPLYATFTRRCASCHHILLKPDTLKASIFKVRHVALEVLPMVRVGQPLPSAANGWALTLCISNPTDEDMMFAVRDAELTWFVLGCLPKHVAVAHEAGGEGRAPQAFIIPGRQEAWEYKDAVYRNSIRLQLVPAHGALVCEDGRLPTHGLQLQCIYRRAAVSEGAPAPVTHRFNVLLRV